jgi:dTDP-4-dehydrorhamnose 3,5-epimerase
MDLHPTPLPGVMEVESPAHHDARGRFQRGWCADSFARAGVAFVPLQARLSTSTARRTLRGMHWQADPHGEQTRVRCVAAAIRDVAVDLRPDSPASLSRHAVELSAVRGNALFLPRGVAHRFLSPSAGAVVLYLIDAAHAPRPPAAPAGTTPPSASPCPRPPP